MKLNQNHNDDANVIKEVDETGITINEQLFDQSCIVSRHNLITDIAVKSVHDLTHDHIEQLLASQPEVVILGSGTTHVFPDVKVLEPVVLNEVGFEVMNNKSAARTYNILLAEERKVACLLIIE